MLSVNRLHVSYGRSRVITDVSFMIGNGERLAVLGRNGVGKTTLLKSIIGLLPPAGGNIIWNGTDISHLPAHRRSRLGIAYVPQGREILPELTVMENLQLGCLERGNMQYAQRRAERMLEYFPELKKHLSRPGGLLSGGQQQQLAVARALATSPELLLLDEPTEGIQPNVVEDLERILKKICKESGLSILLVEQNINFARSMAQKFLILQKGTVACSGPINKLDDNSAKHFLSV
ncbi:MAG TPA: urea ABC transporter ATP-binding subunit UrtE [Ruminococcaceae bacterium]|nr:urea ABC transporter ATP-binding subunit UrtE [Oscillospiraceae bacterium]